MDLLTLLKLEVQRDKLMVLANSDNELCHRAKLLADSIMCVRSLVLRAGLVAPEMEPTLTQLQQDSEALLLHFATKPPTTPLT